MKPESADVGESLKRPRTSEVRVPRVRVQRDHGPRLEGPEFRIEKVRREKRERCRKPESADVGESTEQDCRPRLKGTEK